MNKKDLEKICGEAITLIQKEKKYWQKRPV